MSGFIQNNLQNDGWTPNSSANSSWNSMGKICEQIANFDFILKVTRLIFFLLFVFPWSLLVLYFRNSVGWFTWNFPPHFLMKYCRFTLIYFRIVFRSGSWCFPLNTLAASLACNGKSIYFIEPFRRNKKMCHINCNNYKYLKVFDYIFNEQV